MDGDLISAVVVTVVAVVVVWRGWRTLDEEQLRRWSDRFGPVLDAETRPRIAQALHRGRRLRAGGAAIGIVITFIPIYMNFIEPSRSADFVGPLTGFAWLIGAALGAAVAEIAFVQRPVAPLQAALAPRRWHDYVAAVHVRGVVACVVLAAVAAGGASRWGSAHAGDALVGVGLGLAGLVCLSAGLRRIVDRPRLALEGRLRDVDEALRADGANRLAGAAIAMAGSGAVVALVQGLQEQAPAISLVLLPVQSVVYGWWWFLARDVVWRVDRAPISA